MAASYTPAQNCVMPAIDDFPRDFMTQHQRQRQGGVIVHFLLAAYMFVAITMVCKNYFLPSVEKIVARWRMNSDVAGATVLAVGCSAPELFTSIIGVFITKDDIGIGTIVGSAVFNILFIVAICGLFAGSALRLSRWPLLRDCFCYMVSIAALIVITYDKKVYWYEALVMVCMYLLYVFMMYFNKTLKGFFQGWALVREDIDRNLTESEKNRLLPKQEDEDENPFSAGGVQELQIFDQNNYSSLLFPQKVVSWTLWITALPAKCLFCVTILDCRKDRWQKWYLVSFFVSLMWIAVLSYVLVWMVSVIGFTFGIPDVVMSLTFLAAGGSVPDGISSLMVARQGDGDMAVSNTIGSNVIEILLCLGVPWLLKTTIADFGGYVDILSGSLIYTLISLFVTVFLVVLFIAFNKWYLNKCLGKIFLIFYVVVITVAICAGIDLFGDFNLPTCQISDAVM